MWKWFAAVWNVPAEEAALKVADASVCRHAIDQRRHPVPPRGQVRLCSVCFPYSSPQDSHARCADVSFCVAKLPGSVPGELTSPALVPGSLPCIYRCNAQGGTWASRSLSIIPHETGLPTSLSSSHTSGCVSCSEGLISSITRSKDYRSLVSSTFGKKGKNFLFKLQGDTEKDKVKTRSKKQLFYGRAQRAQPGKCFLGKHEDLHSIGRTHVGKQTMVVHIYNSSEGQIPRAH